MRSAWINGALVAAAVAVGAFTIAAFHAPTQTTPPAGVSSPSPLPSLNGAVGDAGHNHPVVIVKHRPTKPPPKKPHHARKHPTSTYTPPAYTPPAYTPPPQPTPSPILPTLPGGGGTQIPVPP